MWSNGCVVTLFQCVQICREEELGNHSFIQSTSLSNFKFSMLLPVVRDQNFLSGSNVRHSHQGNKRDVRHISWSNVIDLTWQRTWVWWHQKVLASNSKRGDCLPHLNRLKNVTRIRMMGDEENEFRVWNASRLVDSLSLSHDIVNINESDTLDNVVALIRDASREISSSSVEHRLNLKRVSVVWALFEFFRRASFILLDRREGHSCQIASWHHKVVGSSCVTRSTVSSTWHDSQFDTLVFYQHIPLKICISTDEDTICFPYWGLLIIRSTWCCQIVSLFSSFVWFHVRSHDLGITRESTWHLWRKIRIQYVAHPHLFYSDPCLRELTLHFFQTSSIECVLFLSSTTRRYPLNHLSSISSHMT